MQERAKSISVFLACALVATQWVWLPNPNAMAAATEKSHAVKFIARIDTITGTLIGFVLDPTGVGIPGVLVKAINLETGNERPVRTIANGSYKIAFLPLGRYEIRASKEGFVVK